MKALIVGMGIGNLYHSVFTNLGYEIDTVDSDPAKSATYTSVEQTKECYNVAVICTPNFTHEDIAKQIAPQCQIVLIEKPGVKDAAAWQHLVDSFPQTRFMMVKNNQYRAGMGQFLSGVRRSREIKLIWNNKNRIPHPGSWFTTKSLAFGGVSRDLIPHMLSYYCALADFENGESKYVAATQNHRLEDINSTDYGVVNKNGTYDVDDFCELRFFTGGKTWILRANWKSDKEDRVCMEFDNSHAIILGLCPEEAYQTMISTAVENLSNDDFWKKQLTQDLWIHRQIESL